MKNAIATSAIGLYLLLAHSQPVLAAVAPIFAAHLPLVSAAIIDALGGE